MIKVHYKTLIKNNLFMVNKYKKNIFPTFKKKAFMHYGF